MREINLGGQYFLSCRCGYKIELKVRNVDSLKSKKSLEENLIIATEEDIISVYIRVSKFCPHCGHKEAEAWQRQILAADEPSTSFFRCLKCRRVWREY